MAKVMRSPRPLRTYQAKFEGGKVMIEIERESLVPA